MFIDPIAHHALRQPHAIAVALPSADVTFASFDASINAVGTHLKAHAQRGSRVVIMADNMYLHWTLILALGRLGAVSVSIDPSKHEQVLGLLQPDLILSDRPLTGPFEGRDLRVSPAWLKAIQEAGTQPRLPEIVSLNDPARITMSSGTTGTPKKLLFTHGQVQRRIKGGGFNDPGRFHERLLCLVGIDTFGGYVSPLRSWWAGGTVCIFRPMPELIVARHVTGIAASPRQIAGLVKRLPPGFRALPHLSLSIGGARIPRELAVQVRLRLAGHVMTTYGSTEAGAIANMPLILSDMNPQLSGIVLPWHEVEAIDENGAALPPGSIGEIRIRTPEMCTEYLDDPETTAKHFRNGWFYPGDIGSVTAEGLLSILGRVDDIANVGGVKIAPDFIEDVLQTVDGIADVGVFLTQETPPRIIAAIVVDGQPDLEAAKKLVNRKLPSGNVPISFLRVPSIPRNAMGKVERNVLRTQARAMRDQLAAKAAGQAVN